MANEPYRLNQTGDEVQADLDNIEALRQATTEHAGLMSATDKAKLDGLPSGSALETSLGGKVDKVQGKGLSTNDYSDTEKAKAASAYQKPGTGIPKTDLAEGVQASLENADSAYKKPAFGIPSTDLAEGVIPDVSSFITKSVNDLVNYYLKSETYTKAEVQALISAISQFTYESVAELPVASDSTMGIIYLVPSADPQTQNVKDEYITLRSGTEGSYIYSWEQIGSTAIDLSGYVTTSDLNTALADYTTTANLTTLLSGKQDLIDASHKLSVSLLDGVDSAPTANSDNLVTSGGVKTYVDGEIADVESAIEAVEQEMETVGNGAYEVAWDGASTPVVADIPAGVVVTYNTTNYTGELAASASTLGKIYLVSTGTTDEYDRYITSRSGVEGSYTYAWVPLGTTAIQLSDYATKAEVTQLEAEMYKIAEDGKIHLGSFAVSAGNYADFPIPLANGADLELVMTPNGYAKAKVYGKKADSTRTALTNFTEISANTEETLRFSVTDDYVAVSIYCASGTTATSATGYLQKYESPKASKETEDVVNDFTFAHFSDGGVKGYRDLGGSFALANTGDYIEVKMRYYGNSTSYQDKVYFVQGGGYFGIYDSGKVYLRVTTSESWIKWDLPLGVNIKDFHIYKLVKTASGFSLYVDGTLIAEKTYSGSNTFSVSRLGYDETAQLIDCFYFKAYIGGVTTIKNMLWVGATSVSFGYDFGEGEVVEPERNFYEYDDTNKVVKCYMQIRNSDYYLGYSIPLCSSRNTINDEIRFMHFWELQPPCKVFIYNGSTMQDTGVKLLEEGESESVTRATNYDVADFTGGVHGDECIDVDTTDCWVKFYADGVPIDITDGDIPLTRCGLFSYKQKSTLHKTAEEVTNLQTIVPTTSGTGVLSLTSGYNYAIDGVDTGIPANNQNAVFTTIAAAVSKDNVSAVDLGNGYWGLSFVRVVDAQHTIVAYHTKTTEFSPSGYKTRNGLQYTTAGKAMRFYWHCGISCISKNCATEGTNDVQELASFTGTQGRFLEETGLSKIYLWNTTTNMSAVVDTHILNGGGLIADATNKAYIVDRTNDSKYYNATVEFTPNDYLLLAEMSVGFDKTL